ncbi:hypothetical protein [Actinoplanes subtropicus]|uniref:hypothetical protein n=1 Tax=Actinoplanes subtropicus TaxID=543632 RepID=UPI000AEBD373|nr:hypothetical protein [Actinoplanes subtropicus]
MLAEFGLTRIAWQVLNVIGDAGQIAETDILAALAANADAATLTAAIDTVHTDGWATRPAPGQLALTTGGNRRLTTVASRVDAFRELSTSGISPEEYRTAVRVLERMTHHLESTNTQPKNS